MTTKKKNATSTYRLPMKPTTVSGRLAYTLSNDVASGWILGTLVSLVVIGIVLLIGPMTLRLLAAMALGFLFAVNVVVIAFIHRHTVPLEGHVSLYSTFRKLSRENQTACLPLYLRGLELLKAYRETQDGSFKQAAEVRVNKMKQLAEAIATNAHTPLLNANDDVQAATELIASLRPKPEPVVGPEPKPIYDKKPVAHARSCTCHSCKVDRVNKKTYDTIYSGDGKKVQKW